MKSLKEEIQKLAADLNIQKIGFTKADDFEYLRASLIEQKEADTRLVLNIKISMSVYNQSCLSKMQKQSYPSV